jgi:uncharacterized protein (TIGR00299 family) protein
MKAQRHKVLNFDSVGGASGDMVLACLLDLGADPRKIEKNLKKVVKDKFSIEAKWIRQNGFKGVRVAVKVDHHDEHGHHHRGLADIEKLINKSGLSSVVKDRAISVFRRLAEAEAKVHGVSVQKIHFHEVGALDSIIDIIGSCIALEQLGVEKIAIGPLPLGGGTIKCAHGILPSPAPATVELLRGFPVEQTNEKFELVTPTGAALLTTWKNINHVPVGAVLLRSGIGFGHHELQERPNLLRGMILDCGNFNVVDGVADPAPASTRPATVYPGQDRRVAPLSRPNSCLVLECNLDDMSPQLIGNLSEKLLARGALDVFITPVQMKKNRPGVLVTVLCFPDNREKILDIIFRESTTFGVREHTVRRMVLPRRFETVKTRYGKVRVKIGSWGGKDTTAAPEYEDCRKLAEKKGVPLRKVYEAALANISKSI